MSNGIKVSFGDISFGLQDIRRLAAAQWPIVRDRDAVVTFSETGRDERFEELWRNCTNLTGKLQEYRDRAEQAERERDEERAKKETFACAAEHYCKERDEARKQLSDAVHEVYRGHRVPSCKSCEGPLTCGRCAPVVPSIDRLGLGQLVDHEARIKELDTLVQAMGERVNDHERRLRAREGKPK